MFKELFSPTNMTLKDKGISGKIGLNVLENTLMADDFKSPKGNGPMLVPESKNQEL